MTFQDSNDARAAVDCWFIIFVGVNHVKTVLVDTYDKDVNELDYNASMKTRQINDDSITIVLVNLLLEEDFEDEEYLQECREDILTLLNPLGNVCELKLESEGLDKPLVFVTYEHKQKYSFHSIKKGTLTVSVIPKK